MEPHALQKVLHTALAVNEPSVVGANDHSLAILPAVAGSGSDEPGIVMVAFRMGAVVFLGGSGGGGGGRAAQEAQVLRALGCPAADNVTGSMLCEGQHSQC